MSVEADGSGHCAAHGGHFRLGELMLLHLVVVVFLNSYVIFVAVLFALFWFFLQASFSSTMLSRSFYSVMYYFAFQYVSHRFQMIPCNKILIIFVAKYETMKKVLNTIKHRIEFQARY